MGQPSNGEEPRTTDGHLTAHKHSGLEQLPATAICGNDITSSPLYVSALAILQAGQYAWVALLIVAAVLFLFRKIYGEVVGALPLNGGTFTPELLLEVSKKWKIPMNFMFIGSPGDHFLYGLAELGGVRMII